MSKVFIRFENKVTTGWSDTFGPFEWAQLTYVELFVSGNDYPFAYFHEGYWYLTDDTEDLWRTDVVIYSED